MIAALFIIYRIIVAVLALVVIWDIVRERSLAHVMSHGDHLFPLDPPRAADQMKGERK